MSTMIIAKSKKCKEQIVGQQKSKENYSAAGKTHS